MLSGAIAQMPGAYSVGFAVTEKIREAIALMSTSLWTPAVDADGGIRAGGDVAELTGLLELSRASAARRRRLRPPRPARLSAGGTDDP